MAHVLTYLDLQYSSTSITAAPLSAATSSRQGVLDARQSWHHLHPESGATPRNRTAKLENKPSLRTGKQLPTRPGDHERHNLCIYREQGGTSVYLLAALPPNDVHRPMKKALMSRGRVCQHRSPDRFYTRSLSGMAATNSFCRRVTNNVFELILSIPCPCGSLLILAVVHVTGQGSSRVGSRPITPTQSVPLDCFWHVPLSVPRGGACRIR